MARSSPFLLSLGGHSKQAGDEGHLPGDVAFDHAMHLPLADHMHALVPLQRSACGFERKETHAWLDHPLDKTVVLLDQVIEVFDLSQFDRLGKDSRGFEFCNGFGIGGVLIDIDHPRSRRGGIGISQSRGLFHLLLDRTHSRS